MICLEFDNISNSYVCVYNYNHQSTVWWLTSVLTLKDTEQYIWLIYAGLALWSYNYRPITVSSDSSGNQNDLDQFCCLLTWRWFRFDSLWCFNEQARTSIIDCSNTELVRLPGNQAFDCVICTSYVHWNSITWDKREIRVNWSTKQQEKEPIKPIKFHKSHVEKQEKFKYLWDVATHWLSRLLSTGGSWVWLPL